MKTLTRSQKHVAPAEVEGSTGATSRDVRGDGYPLHATYDGPSSLRNVREVVYVAVDTGQAVTHLLKRTEACPTKWPAASSDLRSARVLAYDADASDLENEEYAKLVLNCMVATGTAKVAPLSIVRTVMWANLRAAERIRVLEHKVQQLTVDNEALFKRSRR